MTGRRSTEPLPVPIEIARFWKNRRGEAAILQLKSFEGRNVLDLRAWRTAADGTLRPGKGFCCSVKHLPKLAGAFAKALDEARNIGLLDDDEATP